MQEDESTTADAREAARLSAMKAKVGSHVNAEIGSQASVDAAAGHARLNSVAAGMRERAIDETEGRDRSQGHARTAARGSQFLDYGFYLLYTLLGLRLVLELIAAHSGNGFVRFIGAVTNPFYAPFKGIVASPTSEAGNTFVFPIVIAIVVYALLHLAINGLLRMVGSRKTQI
ncbi:MAG: hypothetical protein WD771_09285 [Gemmatimonadaceae bacterium]